MKLEIGYQSKDHHSGSENFQLNYTNDDKKIFDVSCKSKGDMKRVLVRFNLFDELMDQLNTAIDNSENVTDRTYLKRLRKRAEAGL